MSISYILPPDNLICSLGVRGKLEASALAQWFRDFGACWIPVGRCLKHHWCQVPLSFCLNWHGGSFKRCLVILTCLKIHVQLNFLPFNQDLPVHGVNLQPIYYPFPAGIATVYLGMVATHQPSVSASELGIWHTRTHVLSGVQGNFVEGTVAGRIRVEIVITDSESSEIWDQIPILPFASL